MNRSREKVPIKLKNLYSGEVIEAESVRSFCRKAGLGESDGYHFWPILTGERVHHKGWSLISTFEILNEEREFFYSKNRSIKISGIEFYKRYSTRIGNVYALITGKRKKSKGFFLDKSLKRNYSETIKFISVEFKGKKFEAKSAKELAKKIGTVSRRAIYHWVTEKKIPKWLKIKKVIKG